MYKKYLKEFNDKKEIETEESKELNRHAEDIKEICHKLQ